MKHVEVDEVSDPDTHQEFWELMGKRIKKPDRQESAFYEDVESRKDQEFFLFRGEFEAKDKSLKAFRYGFVIRYLEPEAINDEVLINTLKASSLIITAVDISEI